MEQIDTVIIGGGQAGLAVSYLLTQQPREHVVLERQRIGEAWRSDKWDSFTLVSPNWSIRLPGFAYAGDDPDGYLTRDEIFRYVEEYAQRFDLPVRTGVNVTRVEGNDQGFMVTSDAGAIEAANVVIATGAFQQPRLPAGSTRLASHIVQVHSKHYRNPQQLPPGAVLVVGSAQSGCQITQDLVQAGRKVYLATGKAIRVPRRYRGKDLFYWAEQMGLFDQPVDTLDSPAERFDPNPQLTGKDGGSSLNLHQFALDGVTLLGRFLDGDGTRVVLAPDLHENLARADKPETEFVKAVDKFIAKTGLDAPEETLTTLRAGYDTPIVTDLDLDAAGITAIIWATGYTFDFSWVNFPIYDEYGYPVQQCGVTAVPGLYFVGLQWLHKSKSNLLIGVGEDAAHIADHLAMRVAVR